jgi:hypothetical protein
MAATGWPLRTSRPAEAAGEQRFGRVAPAGRDELQVLCRDARQRHGIGRHLGFRQAVDALDVDSMQMWRSDVERFVRERDEVKECIVRAAKGAIAVY